MSVAVGQQKMFVNGAFVDALSGETMEVLNPATGEVIAEVPRSAAEDVDRAVAAAEQAWVPLAIALGFFLLGAVLLVAWRLAGNERFFGRRAFEAVEPGAGTGVSRT